jgi:hypothetical protein
MPIAYLECFAGISGDMLMGAFVDAGAPVEALQAMVAGLGLGAELRVSKVNRSGIQSTKVDVLVDGRLAESAPKSDGAHSHDHHPHEHSHNHGHSHSHGDTHGHRNLESIRAILAAAPLSERARELSLRAFRVLAEAEGRVHGISPEKVHFHEVGAVDAIVDVAVCACAAGLLDLGDWYASPINLGGGFVDCAHGRFPVPAPATAALLREAPVYSAGPQMELTTPTGAALLRALGCRFDAPGLWRASVIGYGAGTRDPEKFPNVLRLTIGELEAGARTERALEFGDEKIAVLECAIDDATPQLLAYAAQLALERGALDTMLAPVTMKKGRLGTLMTVLAKPADASVLAELLFRETSTLGVRMRIESRALVARESFLVETEFGVIRVKVGSWQGMEVNAAPEFEDCRRAAEAMDVPLKIVMQAAIAAWRSKATAASWSAQRAGITK